MTSSTEPNHGQLRFLHTPGLRHSFGRCSSFHLREKELITSWFVCFLLLFTSLMGAAYIVTDTNIHNEVNRCIANPSESNCNMSLWDTSRVTNMNLLFYQDTTFNQDIGTWNVGQVTDMDQMFRQATTFNQDIGTWNVGQVTYMGYMFYQASAFNQDIGAWNVGQVTYMSGMFYQASAFNQCLENWNTTEDTQKDWMTCNLECPCSSNATCNMTAATSYTCTCKLGYSGDGVNCVNLDDCSSDPCLNGATCNDGVANYSCTCANGFTDATCSTNIDDVNGATSANTFGSYKIALMTLVAVTYSFLYPCEAF